MLPRPPSGTLSPWFRPAARTLWLRPPKGGAAGFWADAPFRGFDFSRNGVPVSTGTPEAGLASLRLPALSPRRLQPNTRKSLQVGRSHHCSCRGRWLRVGCPNSPPPPPPTAGVLPSAVRSKRLSSSLRTASQGAPCWVLPGSVGLQPPSPPYAVPGAIVGGGGASGPLFPAAKMLSPRGARGRSTTLTEPRALAPASGNRQTSPGTGFTASSGLTRAPPKHSGVRSLNTLPFLVTKIGPRGG